MDIQKRCLTVVFVAAVAMGPAKGIGQVAAAAPSTPAPCAKEDPVSSGVDKVSNGAKTASDDTTKLANAGTQLNAAEKKFDTMLAGWRKPKAATAPAKPATPAPASTASTAQTQLAKLTPPATPGASTAPTEAKKPCSKPAGEAQTGSAGKTLVAPGKPAEAASSSTSASFTKMPDGDFMLSYAGAAGAQPTYAKVKQVNSTATAANPHDGIYTDGKSFYMMSDGKLTVTPMGDTATK